MDMDVFRMSTNDQDNARIEDYRSTYKLLWKDSDQQARSP